MVQLGLKNWLLKNLRKKASTLVSKSSTARETPSQYSTIQEADTCEYFPLSILLAAAVGVSIEKDYKCAVASFLLFCRVMSLVLDSEVNISRALVLYFDELFQEGLGFGTGEKVLFGWVHFFPEFKAAAFPSVQRAIKGWRKLRPSTSRHPLPWLVACAIAVNLACLGEISMAVCLILSFDIYLRPYEAYGLRPKDCYPPVLSANILYWCIVVCFFFNRKTQ